MTKKVREQGTQFIENTLLFKKWWVFIEKLAMNRIEWTGLPDTVDERFLERTLLKDGKSGFFNATGDLDDPLFLATRIVTIGPQDIYDNFNSFRSISNTSDNYEVNDGEGVIIWNSTTRIIDTETLRQFANDLAELDILARLNRRQQKWAPILAASKENIGDLERVKQHLSSGEPFVTAISTLVDNISVAKIDLSVPYLQEDIHEDRTNLLNELYNYLGIVNIPIDKPQYMNYDSTGVANDATARVREDLLLPRQQAAEEINKKFGLNVEVAWRQNALVDIVNSRGPYDNPAGSED